MTGHTELRVRQAEEVLPLLALSNASPPSSPIRYAPPSARKTCRCAPASPTSAAPPLSRKYVAYAVDRDVPPLPTPTRKKATTMYGTMAANATASIRKQGVKPRVSAAAVQPRRGEEQALLVTQQQTPDASNQSETESDSDGSCGSCGGSSIHSSRTSTSSLQSILRIRLGEYSCRSLKKQTSVEFALDILDDDDGEDADAAPRKKGDRSCASRCVPRRLTIEEKAALYQVRPDLELTPTAVLLSELEELRRQRQRKLMFSILGATLVLLMMIVFYYLVSQM